MNVCVQTIVLLDRTQIYIYIYIYMIETLHALYSRQASCALNFVSTFLLHVQKQSSGNKIIMLASS